MSAGPIARKPVPRPKAVAMGWSVLAVWQRERGRFWLLVALAALLHAAVILGASLSLLTAPRIMGEREGSQQGLSVELVDAADLESRSTLPSEPATPPGAASAPTPPPTPPEPPQVQEPQPTPQEAQPTPAPEQPWSTTASIDTEAPAAPPEEGPTEKPVEKTPPKEAKKAKEAREAKEAKETKDTKEKAKPAPDRDRLQLTMPNVPNPTFAPGGRATAAARPPNITRSGENDDFGRGVIRALRQTMPQVNWVGRVSIRLLLTEKGNIQEVQLLRSGGDPVMDQHVVFAARQASFPIPPANSTVADRTFYVTYVYHY